VEPSRRDAVNRSDDVARPQSCASRGRPCERAQDLDLASDPPDVYADATEEKNSILMRQSLRGGAPEKVAQGRQWFDVSSDGKLLATAAVDKGAPLQIVSLDSLQTIRRFATRDFDDFERFAFSADDKSIFYVTEKGSDTTIWRQPLETAAPVKVASLPGRTVNWIRPSPDGKKLGLILEAPTSEAVLLHDVR